MKAANNKKYNYNYMITKERERYLYTASKLELNQGGPV